MRASSRGESFSGSNSSRRFPRAARLPALRTREARLPTDCRPRLPTRSGVPGRQPSRASARRAACTAQVRLLPSRRAAVAPVGAQVEARPKHRGRPGLKAAEDQHRGAQPRGHPIRVAFQLHDPLVETLLQVGDDKVGVERDAMPCIKRGRRPTPLVGARGRIRPRRRSAVPSARGRRLSPSVQACAQQCGVSVDRAGRGGSQRGFGGGTMGLARERAHQPDDV